MTSELVTLLDDQEVGRVRRDWRGRLTFVYSDEWRNLPDAYPLSISMPLSLGEHGQHLIKPYLENLLPDDPWMRGRWDTRFHLPANDLLALLAKVGEDCAGAVRFATPEGAAEALEERGAVEWLDEAALAERVRGLWSDLSAWRRAEDPGLFTLSGVQAKTALFFDGQRWGIPSGGIPTTHILKPGALGYDAHAENEHFCLSLAAALGLAVASSQVVRFADEVAIAVERFDRLRAGTQVMRIHQEDLCQALHVLPSDKYESDGGPSPRQIVEVIRQHSHEPELDIGSFVAALIYNWLIAGADAHAKNYALRIRPGGRVNTAPLYDISSSLPYSTHPEKLRLSMAVGGTYRLVEIGPLQWRKLFRELNLEEDVVKAAMTEMADCLPDHATALLARCASEGLANPVLDRLCAEICERAKRCSSELHAWPPLSRV